MKLLAPINQFFFFMPPWQNSCQEMLQKLAYGVVDAAFLKVSLGEFLLTPTCPIEKVSLWVGLPYLKTESDTDVGVIKDTRYTPWENIAWSICSPSHAIRREMTFPAVNLPTFSGTCTCEQPCVEAAAMGLPSGCQGHTILIYNPQSLWYVTQVMKLVPEWAGMVICRWQLATPRVSSTLPEQPLFQCEARIPRLNK